MAEDLEGWQETASKKTHRKERREDIYNENGLEEEIPDFSDPEDFVDDVTEEELMGDLIKKRPQEADGIDSVVVVDNIPQVGPDRQEKLQNVIRKIFTKFGKIVTEHYPMEDNKTKGYIFLEYQNPEQAKEAVKGTNGYKLDKLHTFNVNLFSDFDKYADVPDEWEPPEPQPYKDYGNLRQWLLDPQCYDQFSTIHEGGEKTSIWLNTSGEPTLMEERPRWTETYVRWSTQGTYLATFHQRGIALWGGDGFKQINRFNHSGVQLIDFSPCERYLVTFSPLPDNRDDPQAIIIWDIRSGTKKRGFLCQNASVWPIFKWSHDGKYFARMSDEAISVYETPSFGLLDKKSIKLPGLKDFQWSPTDNIISYWKAGDGNRPASITLLQMPARTNLSTKNLFTVADCKMHWQKSGDYLCVKLDRYRNKREEKDTVKYSGIFHNFNIFRIREKQIPVDTVEVKDAILAFAWEPIGTKFALIHGETPRINVSFYNVKTEGSIELIKTFEKKAANHLFWSPNGKFIVLAGLRGLNGVLEFIDTTDMTVMAQAEHFMATDVEWDPTGRYLCTAVSWWGHKVDNAFWIWNFQGRLIHRQPMERFCQLLYRPRPPSALSPAKKQEIKKNMKKYNMIFTLEDKRRETKASKEQIESRRTALDDWDGYRQDCEEIFSASKKRRMDLRKGVDTDEIEGDVTNFEEERVEFLLEVTETLLDQE